MISCPKTLKKKNLNLVQGVGINQETQRKITFPGDREVASILF
jgi:hypothetical protein